MIYHFIRYMRGYVRIRVSGYSIERFINLCCFQQMILWNLMSSNHYYEMNIRLCDFHKLRPIVRKTHTHIDIIQRKGFPYFLHRYRRRYVVILGAFLCCILVYLYSNTIWSIELKGNEYVTTEAMLQYLKSQNIYSGIAKKDIHCDRINQQVRKDFKDIVWVSASIHGSKLFIHIKENIESPSDTKNESLAEADEDDSQKNTPTDLIATKSGVITEVVTRAGVPQIHVGDTVKAGDLLVSGKVEVRNDSDEIINYQYQESDSDIFASTEYEYQDSIKTTHVEKEYEKTRRLIWFIQFFNYKFENQAFKIKKNQEIHTMQKQLYLTSSFPLPVKIGKTTIISYKNKSVKYTKEEQQTILSANFQHFCEDLVKKGVQITANSVKIHIGVSESTAAGKVFAIEEIDTAVPTEMIDLNKERITTQ